MQQRKSVLMLGVAVLAALATSIEVNAAVVGSLASDFSSTANPNATTNGTWEYGTAVYMGNTAYLGDFGPGSLSTNISDNGNGGTNAAIPIVSLAPTNSAGMVYNPTAGDVALTLVPNGSVTGVLHGHEVALLAANAWNSRAMWRPTTEGDYTYNVTFRGIGNAVNGVEVFRGSGYSAAGSATLVTSGYLTDATRSVTFAGTEHLAAGEFLEFSVNAKAQTGDDSAYWDSNHMQIVGVDATISDSVPEPTTVSVVGLTAISLLGRRRKTA